MSALQFLNKKSWHTSTIKNNEKVWLREQEAANEKARIEELQKQITEERRQQELQELEEKSGRVDEAEQIKRRRLNWMYEYGRDDSDEAVKMRDEKEREDVMLGKKKLDLDQLGDEQREERVTLVDSETKMREDPMAQIQIHHLSNNSKEDNLSEKEKKKALRKKERKQIRENRRLLREQRAQKKRKRSEHCDDDDDNRYNRPVKGKEGTSNRLQESYVDDFVGPNTRRSRNKFSSSLKDEQLNEISPGLVKQRERDHDKSTFHYRREHKRQQSYQTDSDCSDSGSRSRRSPRHDGDRRLTSEERPRSRFNVDRNEHESSKDYDRSYYPRDRDSRGHC